MEGLLRMKWLLGLEGLLLRIEKVLGMGQVVGDHRNIERPKVGRTPCSRDGPSLLAVPVIGPKSSL